MNGFVQHINQLNFWIFWPPHRPIDLISLIHAYIYIYTYQYIYVYTHICIYTYRHLTIFEVESVCCVSCLNFNTFHACEGSYVMPRFFFRFVLCIEFGTLSGWILVLCWVPFRIPNGQILVLISAALWRVVPRGAQERPRATPECPRVPQEHPRGPKITQRVHKSARRGPKSIQECTKSAQECHPRVPKSAPRAPKSTRKGPKE